MFLTLFLYIPVLDNDFASRDDAWNLYENPDVKNLDTMTVQHTFTTIYNGQYSPVNTIYYALVFKLFGPAPFVYNLLSVFIHLINILLVFFILGKILKLNAASSKKSQASESNIYFISFLTALTFAIHPLQVESVAWISASKILLSSLFILTGWYFYLRYSTERKSIQYMMVLTMFLLALGSKEQSVIFPCLLLVTDIFILRKRIFSKSYMIPITPIFLISFAYGFFTIHAQDIGFKHLLQNEYYPFWQRIVLSCYSITEYVFKTIFPINLLPFYKFPMAPGQVLPIKYMFYPFVFFLLVFYVWNYLKKNNSILIFGVLFFMINIALTLHVFPMGRRSLLADRYIYLAIIGIVFPIFFALDRTLVKAKRPLAIYLLLGLYFLFLASYTLTHTYHWT